VSGVDPGPALHAREAAVRLDQPAFLSLLDPEAIQRWAASSPGGPLAGLPFAIKDTIDLHGVPTTAGVPLPHPAAARSAPAVQRLIDAGAVPVGKTHLDQLATGLVGTRNPAGACHCITDATLVSGGSSSGSGVAVAAGVVPLALGTDTAGSGRVPAAFQGLVGLKPTRGLIPTLGVVPACPSLDCVTTLTRTVAAARAALSVLAGPDPVDPWSRPAPHRLPLGVAERAGVIAVPAGDLDLDPADRELWAEALVRARAIADAVVEVDVEPFLAAARLLYEGPWVAERYAAFGHLLHPDGPHLDPVVRAIVLAGAELSAEAAFRGIHRLAELTAATAPLWQHADALLLPTTPGHPTLAAVAADPVGVNARLGTFTNGVNLLDLCAVAVPSGHRPGGVPYGVQLIAPAFADGPLLDLAARWCDEPVEEAPLEPGRVRLAVVGAHLSGLPLNGQLLDGGGRLHRRTRTAPGYRLFALPGGPPARPALVRPGRASVGKGAVAVEVWDLAAAGIGALADTIPAPLGLGRLTLADGSDVLGFVADGLGVEGAQDITSYGGWRAYLRARA